eukprot:TRINITY_DN51887_c0_g1_i1.p1 TRINITY_DN51887_c0_g1~~TRINITY_DN51887_c0_g1_i1.p1  ORF type:complete len:434 (-),score=3.86 TRINITY_DN51887_c0_g1_i1:125-1384(-)
MQVVLLRNFGAGCVFKIIFHVLKTLMKFKIPSSIPVADVLRTGLFFTSFTAVYKLCRVVYGKMLRQMTNLKHSTRLKLTAFLSGLTAGLTVMFERTCRPLGRNDFPMVILLHACYRLLVLAPHYRWLPTAVTHFSHWDTLITCIASCQVLYAYVNEVGTVSSEFGGVLKRLGGYDHNAIEGAGHFVVRNKVEPKLLQFCEKRGIMPPTLGVTSQHALCRFVHPGQNCYQAYFSFARKQFGNYCMVYLPAYLAGSLFGLKNWLNDPIATVTRILKSTLRSGVFLTMYCGNPWAASCIVRYFEAATAVTMSLAVGISGGLSLLVEKKERRSLLAIMFLTHALHSFNNLWRGSAFPVVPIKVLDLLAFCVGMGVHCALFEVTETGAIQQPSLQKPIRHSTVFSILKWALGPVLELKPNSKEL